MLRKRTSWPTYVLESMLIIGECSRIIEVLYFTERSQDSAVVLSVHLVANLYVENSVCFTCLIEKKPYVFQERICLLYLRSCKHKRPQAAR